jgi:tetratricopeptide (TPR) repeat protein
LKVSVEYLNKSLEVFEKLGDKKSIFIHKIRLGHTYHWMEDFQKANEIFHHLLEDLHSEPIYGEYEDFLYQHYGKCKFDEGNIQEANFYFEKAQRIRVEKGNSERILSTKNSIERCNERINR